jgi:hypothetical protein
MAGLEFTFDVTPVNGGDKFRLVARSRALGQWEREFRGRSLAGLDQLKVNDIEEIAWIAAKRDRGYSDNLATFREEHEVDILGPQDLAREDARERARQDAVERGEEWTDADARKFDRTFDREWDGEDEDEGSLGLGPTRKGRSAAR